MEGLGDDGKTCLIGDIVINGYDVDVTVRCYSQDIPTKYVRSLIDQDYFENISFIGFEGESLKEDSETNVTSAKGDSRYSFTLSMRIKGGNDVELN